MTEAEWNACDDPHVLWAYCDPQAAERKKALVRVASCRCAAAVTNQTEQYESAVSVLEGYADRHFEFDAVHRVFTHLSWPAREAQRPDPIIGDPPALFVEEAMIAATAPGGRATERTLRFAQGALEAAGLGVVSARRPLVVFIRDILGNPFRPVGFSPAWRTKTAVALVGGIYESRAFDRLPILADALEDAGCTNADILNHCRQPGEHVRGCWVIDLLTGRQ